MSPAPRITAAGRMNRVLSALLWIAEHDGPTLAEAAARVGVSEATLLADLEVATMIGADSDEYLEMPVEMYVEATGSSSTSTPSTDPCASPRPRRWPSSWRGPPAGARRASPTRP